jgi:hypothetical protein
MDNSRWKNERYRVSALRRSSVETLSPFVHCPSSVERSRAKHLGEPRDDLGYQSICLFNGGTWLVDEAGLDRLPSRAIFGQVLVRKQSYLRRSRAQGLLLCDSPHQQIRARPRRELLGS